MDVTDILDEFARIANVSWVNAPEGPRKDLMAELADALQGAADAKRRSKSGEPVQSLFVAIEESSDPF